MTAQFDRQVSKPLSRLAKSQSLGPEQVRAAIAIEDAIVSILTNDIRSGFMEEYLETRVCAWNSYESDSHESSICRQTYNAWIVAMQQAGLPAGPALDVIIDGLPLTMIDKRWCKRKGWTRDKVKEGLNLYIAIQEQERFGAKRLTA